MIDRNKQYAIDAKKTCRMHSCEIYCSHVDGPVPISVDLSLCEDKHGAFGSGIRHTQRKLRNCKDICSFFAIDLVEFSRTAPKQRKAN